MTLLSRYDSIAETFGGKLGSSKIDNLEQGVERLRDALKGVAIMLNTELAKYEDEPWAQRVREALAQRNTGGK